MLGLSLYQGILIIITIFLIVIAIYKLKYKFWSRQPVFHYHNLWYWLVPPGIIQHAKPKKDIFYDSKIYFDNYFRTSTEKKALFASFIKAHYMPTKNEKYSPPKKGVLNYFKGHNKKSYISLMFHKHNRRKLIGSMTTRPLTCYINNNKLPLYYVDFLCVHQKFRKKGFAPKIIYSHYVNSRYVDNNTVFLFKREGDSTLIVPLTVYNNYLYDIHYWDKLVRFDQPNIKTILITENTFRLFMDVIERLYKSKFKCLIMPDVNHIKLLIRHKQIYVAVTMIDDIPYDLFFYRNTYTSYKGKKSVECFASFKETHESVFVLSFLCGISLIYEISPFSRLFIENISSNNVLIKKLGERYRPIMKTQCSYYFYNFAYRPFLSNQVFLVN